MKGCIADNHTHDHTKTTQLENYPSEASNGDASLSKKGEANEEQTADSMPNSRALQQKLILAKMSFRSTLSSLTNLTRFR